MFNLLAIKRELTNLEKRLISFYSIPIQESGEILYDACVLQLRCIEHYLYLIEKEKK